MSGVRYLWEPDYDFEIDGFYGYQEPEQTIATTELRDKLNSGGWVAETCTAQVRCECCGEWTTTDSLCGIVHAPGDEYSRTIEQELSLEITKEGP